MFDELPTFYTIVGGLFIIAAGLLITYSNYFPTNKNKTYSLLF